MVADAFVNILRVNVARASAGHDSKKGQKDR